MLKFVSFSFLVLFHPSLESDHLEKMLKAHPTWSFELVSVDAMIKESVHSFTSVDANLTEDMLRAKIEASLGTETTHIVRKIGDPKWSINPPASFDAREKWKECATLINEVEDEGACYADGSAVAASVAADRYCIFTNGTSKDRLSHEMLSGCAEPCTKSPWILRSFRYLTKYGIPTGGKFRSGKGCLPYEISPCIHTDEFYPPEITRRKRGTHKERDTVVGKLKRCDELMVYDHICPTECSNSKYPISLDEDRKKFSTFYTMDNEFLIRREMLEYGPVATSIILYDDFFDHPKGIYWKKPTSEMRSWDKYLKLVGWGEENGTKYWIAINTWEGWGDTKEFKIPRGINHVFVESQIFAGVFDQIN